MYNISALTCLDDDIIVTHNLSAYIGKTFFFKKKVEKICCKHFLKQFYIFDGSYPKCFLEDTKSVLKLIGEIEIK